MLVDLYGKGFDLYRELAQTLPLETYREVRCYSVHPRDTSITTGTLKHTPPVAIAHEAVAANRRNNMESHYTQSNEAPIQDVPWLKENYSAELLDHHAAQITPQELVDKMLVAAIAHGTKVLYDTVDGLLFADAGVVNGVTLQCNGELYADKVLLCMGPWTGRDFLLF